MKALAALVLFVAPVGLAGQSTAAGPVRTWTGAEPVGPFWNAPPIELSTQSPGVVTTASLLLPGSGQLLLGQRRWPVYAAAEAIGWLVHLNRRRDGRRIRDQYRDLAWLVARAGAPEPRLEGDWEYYERLEQWTTSGRWDAEPERVGLQPESDPGTFNGSVWALARDLFLPEDEGEGTEAYARAMEYYRERAYRPELLWDWTGQPDNQERYRDLIDRSDEALRTATVVLGAVVANHLLSAVDAYISARLGGDGPVSSSASLVPSPFGPTVEWRVELRP